MLPVLEPLGRAMFHLGPLGLGNTMKLVNSLIAFTTTWVSLEGLSLAAKAGIPVQRAVERAPHRRRHQLLPRAHGRESIDQRGRPTMFALDLAAKDAGLIVETGERWVCRRRPAPRCCRCSSGHVAAGLGDHDWSDLVAVAERAADVELRWTG